MSTIIDPLNHMGAMMIAGVILSFFSAFQDVATDAMAIDILPKEEQARANGLMWGSKTLGVSSSLAAGSWMLNNIGFSAALITLALLSEHYLFSALAHPGKTGRKIPALDAWKIITGIRRTPPRQLDRYF